MASKTLQPVTAAKTLNDIIEIDEALTESVIARLKEQKGRDDEESKKNIHIQRGFR